MLDLAIAAGSALALGAAGNAAGKSEKVGGEVPWNKVLAPLGSVLGPIIARKLGVEMTGEQLLAVSVAVSGAYSWGKNFYQLIKSIIK